MTSNLGSELLLSNNKNRYEEVNNLLKKKFKPEFLNRIDEIIMFNPLGKDTQLKIVSKLLKNLDLRLLDQNINITFTNNLKEYILSESYNPDYGARPVKRYIQKHIETFIATKIIKGEIAPNVSYVLDIVNNKIQIF
jgi:ATP-dependent Clp protease ATP-binding subunit ClpB